MAIPGFGPNGPPTRHDEGGPPTHPPRSHGPAAPREAAGSCKTAADMRLSSVLAPVLALCLMSGACGDDDGPLADGPDAPSGAVGGDGAGTSIPEHEDDERDDDPTVEATGAAGSLWPVDLSTLDPEAPPTWTVEVVESYPHDVEAFTQGLELLADGTAVESTGLRGLSTIRIVDLESGEVTASAELEPTEFGEGATRVGDTIIQLTWQEEVARRWQLPSLTPLEPFSYDGEGWGLCLADDRLAMSDGSSDLEWRDPATFDVLETVTVRLRGEPVVDLNELECIDDHVIANVWFSDFLVVIRGDGAVVATIDASELVATTPVAMSGDVLNGVADLGDGTLLLGGKRWPTFYRVRLVAE